MNKLFALELLGFINGTDFTMDINGVITWLSDEQMPPEAEMQTAWDNWVVSQVPVRFDRLKHSALRKVESRAEKKRLTYITRGYGQMLVYEQKAKEAEEFVANGYSNPENYPFIKKEADALGQTPQQIADLVLQRKAEWSAVGSTIEALRLTAKETISSASTEEEINSAFQNFIDSLDAI